MRGVAIDIAHNLLQRNNGASIEIRDNATGARSKLLPDGRLV